MKRIINIHAKDIALEVTLHNSLCRNDAYISANVSPQWLVVCSTLLMKTNNSCSDSVCFSDNMHSCIIKNNGCFLPHRQRQISMILP